MDRSDLSGSLSGGSSSSSSPGCFNIDLCPDLIVATLAVFASVAFFMIYQAVTMAARRKRRSLAGSEQKWSEVFWLGNKESKAVTAG